jgi:hypothetical protein
MEKLSDNLFIQKYIACAVSQLEHIYPRVPVQFLRKIVTEKVQAMCKDIPVSIVNSYTHFEENTTLLKVVDFIEREKPIIAGNGSFYKHQATEVAPTSIMLRNFFNQRKAIKKQAFQYRDNEDTENYVRYLLWQNNIKKLMNSFYGSMGEKNSYTFNESTASATTAQGRSIISTTLWFAELFLGNNLCFISLEEVMAYIDTILTEENHLELFDCIEYIPDPLEVTLYYMRHYEDSRTKKKASKIVYHLMKQRSEIERIKLYYKNNLYEFIERNPEVKTMLTSKLIRSDIPYIDPYQIPPQLAEPMEQFVTLLREFVFTPNHISYDKIYKFRKKYRIATVYSDTDSGFVYVGDWLFKVINYMYGVDIPHINMDDYDQTFILSVISIIIYIISLFLKQVYETLLTVNNIDPEYRSTINAKNEYVMDRIILFNVKKNYVYRVIANEGVIFKKAKFEIKGQHLNPKSKNVEITAMIQKAVYDVTMSGKTIKPETLINVIYDLKEVIVTSIKHKETRLLLPLKIKEPSGYKTPESMFTLKALDVFRIATGATNILLPNTYYVIDMYKMNTVEDIKPLKTINPEVYERLVKGYFSNRKCGGITYVALPLTYETIPDWIYPYIQIEYTWRKHLTPLITLCESLGIKVDTIRSKKYYSTVLQLS